jgi:DNA-binding NarL/FixJ family response regulator
MARLSKQECIIVHKIAEAKSNKVIAYEMKLSIGTVKEYLHRIFVKLHFTNRTEVALWAANFLKGSSNVSNNVT